MITQAMEMIARKPAPRKSIAARDNVHHGMPDAALRYRRARGAAPGMIPAENWPRDSSFLLLLDDTDARQSHLAAVSKAGERVNFPVIGELGAENQIVRLEHQELFVTAFDPVQQSPLDSDQIRVMTALERLAFRAQASNRSGVRPFPPPAGKWHLPRPDRNWPRTGKPSTSTISPRIHRRPLERLDVQAVVILFQIERPVLLQQGHHAPDLDAFAARTASELNRRSPDTGIKAEAQAVRGIFQPGHFPGCSGRAMDARSYAAVRGKRQKQAPCPHRGIDQPANPHWR